MLLLLFLCVQDSPAASGQHTGLQVSISSKGLEYCEMLIWVWREGRASLYEGHVPPTLPMRSSYISPCSVQCLEVNSEEGTGQVGREKLDKIFFHHQQVSKMLL